MTRPNGRVNDIIESNPKPDTYNEKTQLMNDQSDHLFYFVQVSIHYNKRDMLFSGYFLLIHNS